MAYIRKKSIGGGYERLDHQRIRVSASYSLHLEDKEIVTSEGPREKVRLFARGGAIGIVRLTESGDPIFVGLERARTHRNRDLSGTYRWYNEFRLPPEEAAGR